MKQRNRLYRAGLIALGATSLCALVAMALQAWHAIQGGHGMDHIRTVWLVEDDWYGVLAFMLALILGCGIALVWRIYDRRRERMELSELERATRVDQ